MLIATEISNCGFKRMAKPFMNYKPLILIFLFIPFHSAFAQNTPSSDELFQRARKTAFELKDYPKAIALSKQALAKSPDYSDIRIFLGRLYTWSKKSDSARTELAIVLKDHPDNDDAALAMGSLEYWNNNPEAALQVVGKGLHYHPDSKDLLLLKAKALSALNRYREAGRIIDTVLKIDPQNTDARALSGHIADKTVKNKVSANYDFTYFDKEYDSPWHLASVDYTQQTDIGSIIGRINYANRFQTSGFQAEVDAYPHISRVFYAYVSGGYAGNGGIFPRYRAGFSLYANLPAAFEGEAGFRFLSYGRATWIYTASVGKYYKNFWFNLRTFITPSNNSLSQSFLLNTRYYYSGANDYFTLTLGTGLSPDDILNSTGSYTIRSNNIGLGYRHAFKPLNIAFINLSWVNTEYLPHVKGNQYDIGIGYIKGF